MVHPDLHHLNAVRSFLSSLSGNLGDNPELAQATVYGKLLDYMIVEGSLVLELKTAMYDAVQQLLPKVEDFLDGAEAGLLNELKSICAKADKDAFDNCLATMSQLQRHLLLAASSEANYIVKEIIRIETNYSENLVAAVAAQSAAALDSSESSLGAWHTRNYKEQDLLDFIVKTFPEESEASIEGSGFISGGSSKFTVSLTLTNTKEIPSEIILRGDSSGTFGGASVLKEYHLLKTLYEHGANVAKPLALEKSGNVFGSPFMLMEKKTGGLVGHMFNLPGPNRELCVDIAANLAKVHQVPISPLGDAVDNANGLASEKALSWIEQGFNDWKPLKMPSPVFETAFSWLRSNAALNDQVPRGLVHGDYGLNNLLVHEGKVSTILDWEFAHIGNQAYDLGYFYFMAEDLASWDEFLKAYAEAGGTIPPKEQLNYHILLAATRLGVMVFQTAAAFTSGEGGGLIGVAGAGERFCDITIQRISGALENVL